MAGTTKSGDARGRRGRAGEVWGEERKEARPVICCGERLRTRWVLWICRRAQSRAAVLSPTP